jgi:hypothetical protein
LRVLAEKWPDESTHELLRARAVEDQEGGTRRVALRVLAEKWPDESTRDLLRARAVEDQEGGTRGVALRTLAEKWPDESTHELLRARAVEDPEGGTRGVALRELAERWPDESTRDLLRARAAEDPDILACGAAFSVLGAMHSEFGRLLPTKNLDGAGPYLNPRMALPRDHIEKAASRTGIASGDIDAQLASLSKHLGWDVTRGARPSPSE